MAILARSIFGQDKGCYKICHSLTLVKVSEGEVDQMDKEAGKIYKNKKIMGQCSNSKRFG